ncbi:Phosphate-binding protein PstS [Seminavis robusta]|uniref:Phosphate-binding protein PstS n=1 Tax=Seminavis robusta TaxID=568900 RepID=A0A9N8EVF9_9STRA|nr:Phosphate-binding protein PstS [Seminavis robusta]|eukprot:Sro1799_g298400.1 Phosphate-binding protein PstS (459) ;mRNA; r:16687-18157
MMMIPPSRQSHGMPGLLFLLLAATVKAQTTLSIHGSGTTNPAQCYWSVMEKMETRAKIPVQMTYRAIGSSSGQAEFSESDPIVSHFGSGDIPLRMDRYQDLSAAETVLQLPVFVGAVSFYHSLPNTPALNLTACALARIFTGEITSWVDNDIKELNPNLDVSGDVPVRVARRVDGSGSTSLVTNYLAAACPDVWSVNNVGSMVAWHDSSLECQGSGGMVDCIEEEPGTIGYLAVGQGRSAGLVEVAVENSFGTRLTSIQSQARGGIAGAADTIGLLPSSAADDFSSVSLLNQPGEFTWPMAALTYIYVRQDLTSFLDNPQDQALLKAFLEALYRDDYVEQCVENYAFVKVDGAALRLANDAIDSLIMDPSATPFTFETFTDLVDGMGDYVFSIKRKSGTEVEIEALTRADDHLLELLERQNARIALLESMLEETVAAINKKEQFEKEKGFRGSKTEYP